MRKEIGVMPREYFFISDMHIGGDGELQNCDFEDELIEFLEVTRTAPRRRADHQRRRFRVVGVHNTKGRGETRGLDRATAEAVRAVQENGQQDTDHDHAWQPRLRAGLLSGVYRPFEGL